MEQIRDDVISKLFSTPNNGSLGISIVDFGDHHTLSLKI